MAFASAIKSEVCGKKRTTKIYFVCMTTLVGVHITLLTAIITLAFCLPLHHMYARFVADLLRKRDGGEGGREGGREEGRKGGREAGRERGRDRMGREVVE